MDLTGDLMIRMGKFANLAEVMLDKGTGERLVLTTANHVLIAQAEDDAIIFKVVEQNGTSASAQS